MADPIALPPEALADLEVFLADRVGGCFLCRQILEDIRLHKALTGHPKSDNVDGKTLFPPDAKKAHLKLESFDLSLFT